MSIFSECRGDEDDAMRHSDRRIMRARARACVRKRVRVSGCTQALRVIWMCACECMCMRARLAWVRLHAQTNWSHILMKRFLWPAYRPRNVLYYDKVLSVQCAPRAIDITDRFVGWFVGWFAIRYTLASLPLGRGLRALHWSSICYRPSYRITSPLNQRWCEFQRNIVICVHFEVHCVPRTCLRRIFCDVVFTTQLERIQGGVRCLKTPLRLWRGYKTPMHPKKCIISSKLSPYEYWVSRTETFFWE